MGLLSTPPPSLPFYIPENNSYIPLPRYHPYRGQRLRRCTLCVLPITVFAVALFFLYPSQPSVILSRFSLDHIHLSTKRSSLLPTVTLDISLHLDLNVRNKDFFSLDYKSLVVSIGYRGKKLGSVTSNGGHLRARGSSYVNATLQLDGIEILHNVIYLIDDMTKGMIPFDTVTEVEGKLGIFFFDLPIQAKMSCEVYVNIDNQTIIRQDCYPE